MRFTTLRCAIAILCAGLFTSALPQRGGPPPEQDQRLPNGKLQRDEILKADFQKSLEDARVLSKLADELKVALEKNDRYVLSIGTLKKTEEIERLARRIRDRLKH